MLHYAKIENNYRDDSVYVANAGEFDEAALLAGIRAQRVSNAVFDVRIPDAAAARIAAMLGGGHAIRAVEPLVRFRTPSVGCYCVQNPVLDLSGRLLTPFSMKKLNVRSNELFAHRLIKGALSSPGLRITWKCTAPVDAVVDTLRPMRFDKPASYLECSTQHGETFRWAAGFLPAGSTLYAMDFYQKAMGFPVSPGLEARSEIVRLGYTGNRGYIRALQDLEESRPGLTIDVGFFDAAHEYSDVEALGVFSRICRVTIVHDANFATVADACDRAFTGRAYTVHQRPGSRTVSRIYGL